ncbi:hypothetical protein BJ508DRAFT_25225 [Ascobolus immersus RN42]|uniref:BHLH domain-containing protein n=1 Tax=Ascobolus immersus RN42 TaxID=1160509 RepID=A0A3N4IEX1_ASCIM|nr:hypothetical protein BJ508DRAFT_25225 [Ascobolus immersus RN42]
MFDYGNDHFNYSESFAGRESAVNPADIMGGHSFPRNIPQHNTNVYHNGFGSVNDYSTNMVSDADLVLLAQRTGQKNHYAAENATMMDREPSQLSEYAFGTLSPEINSPSHRPFDVGSAPDSFEHSPFVSNYSQSFGGFHHRSVLYGNADTPSSMASPLVGASDDSGSKKGMLSKSPHTPSGMGPLSLNIPGAVPQPIHKRHTSHSGAWDGTPGSFAESALSSPGLGISPHPPIQDIMQAHIKHASLPAKVDAFQSQEAKRRRRRESHNMVERRRRDNINERIQELSHLVPHHRLDDEKVRKHLNNNTALPPSIAGSSMSPPRGNMMNAAGRRGSSTLGAGTGLPGDDKDKGPNKGDILNGAVYWTRDLMWNCYQRIQQEKKLKEFLASINKPWPFEKSEEEERFEAELVTAMEKNGVANFSYSRHPGSGLHVPGFTMLNGERIQNGEDGSMEEKKPTSADDVNNNYWNDSEMTVKEEEEFTMESF